MVWSRNDHWMVTADQTGYVKYWQSNMNNVKMFQAHKEPVRAIRCAHTTGFGDVLLTCICIIDSLVFAINKFDIKLNELNAMRNKVSIICEQNFSQIKSNIKSVTFVTILSVLLMTTNKVVLVIKSFTHFRLISLLLFEKSISSLNLSIVLTFIAIKFMIRLNVFQTIDSFFRYLSQIFHYLNEMIIRFVIKTISNFYKSFEERLQLLSYLLFCAQFSQLVTEHRIPFMGPTNHNSIQIKRKANF